MNHNAHAASSRVRQVTLHDGYLHIDLSDGLRLSGPLQAGAPGRHGALVETGPGSAWDAEHNLDALIGD